MGRRKVATAVYITEEQDEKLHALSERTRIPIAVWVRDGVDLVLEREHAPPASIRVTSGTEDK